MDRRNEGWGTGGGLDKVFNLLYYTNLTIYNKLSNMVNYFVFMFVIYYFVCMFLLILVQFVVMKHTFI